MVNITLLLLLVFWFSSLRKDLSGNGVGEEPMVPAVYVFGDSGTDAGNNNYLNTEAKADKFPYGIDLNNQTGRFTNGKTVADFIANFLGLPMAPAYLSLDKSARSRTTTGINYASGGCGILDVTGVAGCLTLREQVKFFASTVKDDLPNALQSTERLRDQLAESICLLIIGSNDKFYKLSPKWNETNNEQIFLEYLFQTLVTHIETLYNLGARKFVVHNVYGGSFHFPEKLKQLQSHLSNSTFTQFYPDPLTDETTKNKTKYGLKYLEEPCFIPEVKPVCHHREEYYYFDNKLHLTQTAHRLAAEDCFNGTITCNPYNTLALAQTQVSSNRGRIISAQAALKLTPNHILVIMVLHVFILLLQRLKQVPWLTKIAL